MPRPQFTRRALLGSVALFCMAAIAFGAALPSRTNGCGTAAIPPLFAAWGLTAFGVWLLAENRSLAVWGAVLAIVGFLAAAYP
jgi:hypothetical protein